MTADETARARRCVPRRGELLTSPLGPVAGRAAGKVYVVRTAGDGEFRSGEQFLRMMRASSLDAWRDAMRMQARGTSNFTYADRAGNVFCVWNAFLPRRPHPAGRDSVVIAIRETREAWARMLAWDSLPQLLNPAGGYLQNANDPPHFTTLAAPLDSAALPIGVPGPALSLRSQLSLSLIHGDDRLDLEDVVIRKHSPDTSLTLCAMVKQYDLQLFEQPAPKEDIEGLARVRRKGGIPVMADETISDHASLIKVIKADAADFVMFGIKQAGGILRASRMLATAEAAGIPCVIGHGFGLDPSTLAEISSRPAGA